MDKVTNTEAILTKQVEAVEVEITFAEEQTADTPLAEVNIVTVESTAVFVAGRQEVRSGDVNPGEPVQDRGVLIEHQEVHQETTKEVASPDLTTAQSGTDFVEESAIKTTELTENSTIFDLADVEIRREKSPQVETTQTVEFHVHDELVIHSENELIVETDMEDTAELRIETESPVLSASVLPDLEKAVEEIWQTPLIRGRSRDAVITQETSSEEIQTIPLSENYLAASLLQTEKTMITREGDSVSMADVTLEQITEQLQTIDDPILREGGLEIIETMSEITQDIHVSMEVVLREIEVQYSEIAIPPELQVLLDPEQPATVEKMVTQLARIDPDVLPESVAELYRELLQKIIALQEANAKLATLFDISYDPRTHQIIVLPKNTDPMREIMIGFDEGTDDNIAFPFASWHLFLGQLAIRRQALPV